MRITVESLSSVKKKINIEVPALLVTKEIDKVFQKIKKKASIKGFRKGKVPLTFLEKHYNDAMIEDVMKNLVQDSYYKAIMEQKISPVSAPIIESDDLIRGNPFKYSATVEVIPEIDKLIYTGLEVSKEKYKFDAEIIERRLKDMQESMAQVKPLSEDRCAIKGDFVTIDFEGFIDNVPFEHGNGTDFQLEIGSGRFIPGFEDQLIGMFAGQPSDIKVTFPDNYNVSALAGKEAIFKITIKEIKVKELPPIDDDFAKEFGDFETLEELRAKLNDIQEQQELARIENDCKNRILKELIAKNPCDVPEALIDRQLEQMLDSTRKRLAAQKLTLEMMGLDEKNYKERYKKDAEEQVKGFLLLEALIKQHAVAVEDHEIDARIAEIAAQHNQSIDVIKKFYMQNNESKENLIMQIKEDKVMALLINSAKISEVAREDI